MAPAAAEGAVSGKVTSTVGLGAETDLRTPRHLHQRPGPRGRSPVLLALRWSPAHRAARRRPQEAAISTPLTPASQAFADGLVAEGDALAAARVRAEEVGVSAVTPGTGATLCFLASALGARSVVEIGTGTGVSALWLLRGMRSDGVLTTVDVEAEHQRLARTGFTEAGIAPSRVRTIAGAALDVLPRLTDGHYDLVMVDADGREYAAYLDEALRLLRPGGVVVLYHALGGGRAADPSQRDEQTVAVRDLIQGVVDREDLVPVLLPVGDGLLVATKVG